MYHICYLYILETRTIPWADEEEDDVLPESKDIVTKLLCTDPSRRLSLQEVKQHSFFNTLEWCSLLEQMPQFIPELECEDDTSYFDSKLMYTLNLPRVFEINSN